MCFIFALFALKQDFFLYVIKVISAQGLETGEGATCLSKQSTPILFLLKVDLFLLWCYKTKQAPIDIGYLQCVCMVNQCYIIGICNISIFG